MDLAGIDFLIQHMKRLDENVEEEATGIYNSLNIIENITDIYPESQKELVIKPNLITFLLQIISKSPVEQNKFYAAEILSILVTDLDEGKEMIGKHALEQILVQLAVC